VTWPLASVELTDSGIVVDVRSHSLKRFLRPFVGKPPSSPWWIAEWGELGPVDFGRRSVVLRAGPHRSCRFVTLTRRKILPLVEELMRQNVAVVDVSSTIGWFFRST
jgi:hypothetical protein